MSIENAVDDAIGWSDNALKAPIAGKAAISYSFWCYPQTLRPDQYGPYEYLCDFGHFNGASAAVRVILSYSGKINLKVRTNWDESYGFRTANPVLTTGSWQHIVITIDIANDQIKIYRNGVLDTTDNHAWTDTTFVLSGTNPDPDMLFSGQFDGVGAECALFNGVLAQAGVDALYAGGSIVHRMPQAVGGSNLLGYWPLHDGNAGTVVGAAVYPQDFGPSGYHQDAVTATPDWIGTVMSILGAGPLSVMAAAAAATGVYYPPQQHVLPQYLRGIA